MAETPAAKKAKKSRKLVPIVNTRRRRPIKKEVAVKPPTEHTSEAFKELVEAAHKDATWQRGSARPRPGSANVQSSVTFGGTTGVGSYHAESRRVVWPGAEIKTEPGLKTEEKDEMMEDAFPDDPFRPTTIPIRSVDPTEAKEDTEKLLPQYIEQKLLETNSEESYSTAHELSLTETASNPGAILFQLPSDLPISAPTLKEGESDGPHLPEGRIGRLSVHESGKVRLHMGDVVLDVSSGTPWPFHQQLVAINVREEDGHCVFMGDVRKRAIATVNVAQLLETRPQNARPPQELKQDVVQDADGDVRMDTAEPEPNEQTHAMMGVTSETDPHESNARTTENERTAMGENKHDRTDVRES